MDIDAEILCIVATEIGNMIPFVGGEQYYSSLLEILEKLCSVDEIFVAENVMLQLLLCFSF
jgi:hypothetical protein